MGEKVSASELKRIAVQYQACVTKCQEAAYSLRGGECSDGESAFGDVRRSRIDVGPLSQRELEVFALIGYGLTTKQMAKHLAVTPSTIETYRERLKRKLAFSTTTSLIRAAVIWTVELGGHPLP